MGKTLKSLARLPIYSGLDLHYTLVTLGKAPRIMGTDHRNLALRNPIRPRHFPVSALLLQLHGLERPFFKATNDISTPFPIVVNQNLLYNQDPERRRLGRSHRATFSKPRQAL
jgi:hypothetical protein